MMKTQRLRSFHLLFGALLCGTAWLGTVLLEAQIPAAAPRIAARVDEAVRTSLTGNVPSLARAEFDQGEVAPTTTMNHLRLVLSRSSQQQAALDQYLADLQNPASPNYHKWLTPEKFGKLYGPADADVATLVAWLESHGLTLESVSTGRTNIAFSGAASQVEEAFHTSIHSFQANGNQFYSNTTDPQIPSALTSVVKGVAHLNTIAPKPQFVRGNVGNFNPQTNRLETATLDSASRVQPNLTTGTSSSNYFLYVVPADAATIYDVPNTTLNANYSSGVSYTGAGINIGIGGDATIQASIVGAYRSTFLGSSTSPTIYYCTSATSCSSSSTGTGIGTSDSDEAYLDTELSGGIAPGAAIYYYASKDLYSGMEAAINANVVDIFSLSFGSCEQQMSTSDNAQINALWQQAAGQGIAVVVSSGDSGSAGCDYPSTNTGKNVTVATGGLQVNGFASTPYNIAVGGTDFYALYTAYSTYASTSQGSASTYYRTALGYIPESTWNDSSYYDTTVSANVPWTAISGYTSSANIVGGSGGVSSCSTNKSVDNANGSVTSGACTSGYAKPTWQTGTGVPADGARDLPDVSLLSGNGFDSATWLVCTNDTEKVSGVTVTTSCLTQSNGYFYFTGFGGTSTAAPAFAGILALVQQKTGSRLGQAAKQLYALYNSSNSSQIFHDVTVGNNSVPCTSSTPNCTLNAAGYYFESGYNTTAGYDLATGMGSVDVKNLLTYWNGGTGGTGPISSTFTLAASAPTAIATPGGSTTSIVTVSSSTLYAGNVTLSCTLTSPTTGVDLPTCSGNQTVALSSTTTSAPATFTVSTTAASAALVTPKRPGSRGWTGAGGGAVLALLLFIGMPARRRSWRSMLGLMLLTVALGGLSACGGGSSASTGSTGNAGTTAGTYTFTVTGTGSPAVTPVPSATFTVTVN